MLSSLFLGGIPTLLQTVKSAMGHGYAMLWFSFGITCAHLTHGHVSSVVCIQSNQSTSKSKTDSSQPFSYKEIAHILMGFCFLTGEFAQDHVAQRFRNGNEADAAEWRGVLELKEGGCQMCTILHTSFPCSLYTLNHLHISCNGMSYVLLCGSLYFQFFCHPKVSNKIRITIFRLQALFFLFCMFQLLQTLDTSSDLGHLTKQYNPWAMLAG